MKNILMIVGIAIALGALIWVITANRGEDLIDDVVYVAGDPLELTLDTVNQWKDILATSSEASLGLEEFLVSDIFAPALRQQLIDRNQDTAREPMLDVIFCQAEVPPRLVGRLILETPTEAQVMVLARGTEDRSPYQAVIALAGNGEGAWTINKIDCVQGEVAPEVEFTFDHEGYLLKSVPAPYQSGSWHVVFEQDGQMGYVAPLVFDAESVCIDSAGTESVCDPDTLLEPIPALIQGEMTESGVTVKRVTFK